MRQIGLMEEEWRVIGTSEELEKTDEQIVTGQIAGRCIWKQELEANDDLNSTCPKGMGMGSGEGFTMSFSQFLQFT